MKKKFKGQLFVLLNGIVNLELLEFYPGHFFNWFLAHGQCEGD